MNRTPAFTLPLRACMGLACGLILHLLPLRAQVSSALAEVRIRGDVRRIQRMPDGSFVLGGFTAYVNGNRDTQLLRIGADGTRRTWAVAVDGPVFTLALDGPWLYLGGDFKVVNSVSVPFAARVDATSGQVDPTWHPAPNGDLLDIVPLPGGIALSGSFSRLGGLPRNRLALVSRTGSGLPIEAWKCDADDQVDRLLLHNGWLYAGGRFKRIGGTSIPYLVRIQPGTGAVDVSWAPTPNGPLFDLDADGTHLYCGGGFTRMAAANVPFLARIPLATSSADPLWAPIPDGLVARVCVSGDSVYAAGNFTTISGLPQKYLARIERSSGNADRTWSPPLDGTLLALEPDGAGGLWGGGRFDSDGVGSGFAHFTANQGRTAPAYPATIENIGAVKVIRPDPAGGGWLVGGDFDTVAGVKRHALFRLGPGGALDAGWNARLGGLYTEVNALQIQGGNILIGGQFEVPGIGGELLYNCLLLNLRDGTAVTTFKPQPSSTVQAIVPYAGGWLLGGLFTQLGKQAIPYLAVIGATGQGSPAFPQAPSGPVHCILVDGDETYLGGEFTGFNSKTSFVPLPYLARLRNNAPDPAWQPRPNQAVFTLALDGNNLFAGGRFTSLARQRRRFLAQIPLGGAGTPTPWNPAPDDEVRSLRVAGGNLYVGGAFFTISRFVWSKLARFALPSLELDRQFFSTGESGAVYTVEPQINGDLLVGGSFNGWDNDFSLRSLIRISPGTPAPQEIDPGDGSATDSTPSDEVLSAYFASANPGRIEALGENTLAWTEQRALPPGMVARVQWSPDLATWLESGEALNGITCTASIFADGSRRLARIDALGEGGPRQALFLRLVVEPADHPPAKHTPLP